MTDAAPGTVYEDGLRQGLLRFQWCGECDSAVFYPRTLCPGCGSSTLVWRSSEGRGTVYSATLVAERNGPGYVVALVDLDEGFRMMSTVTGTPEQVRIGDRVRLSSTELAGQPAAVFSREVQ